MSRAGRVLVTGAAGFIGSTLVDRLLAEGREVVGFDSFDPFYDRAQKEANLAGARDAERFRLETGDIRDPDAMARVFAADFDGVVHLAALAGVRPSLERPAEYADVNVTGAAVLLSEAARRGAPRVVFASSSSVYGEREQGPFRESDPVERPVSPYAATKKANEAMAHAYFTHVHWEPWDDLEQRTARLLPGLFLARVDGKSPVEYLTDEADKMRVRRVSRSLLWDPVSQLSEVKSAWRKEIGQ